MVTKFAEENVLKLNASKCKIVVFATNSDGEHVQVDRYILNAEEPVDVLEITREAQNRPGPNIPE